MKNPLEGALVGGGDPATAGVLILLWIMIFSTLFRTGLHLPAFSLEAFLPPNLRFTIGPAIFSLSDPSNAHISVFTQTMDHLLPDPLPYFGSLVGILVLMSACAASAQGL